MPTQSEFLTMYLQPVLEYLNREINPFAVYLFGSAVKGALRDDSDVDLAFLADRAPSPYEQFLISQAAADILQREVDLINLEAVDTVFCAQIVTSGQLLVNRDWLRVATFQIRTLKEYALLNEERDIILRRIRDRGSLYGG